MELPAQKPVGAIQVSSFTYSLMASKMEALLLVHYREALTEAVLFLELMLDFVFQAFHESIFLVDSVSPTMVTYYSCKSCKHMGPTYNNFRSFSNQRGLG